MCPDASFGVVYREVGDARARWRSWKIGRVVVMGMGLVDGVAQRVTVSCDFECRDPDVRAKR